MVARKYGTRMVRELVRSAEAFYICSFSSRTILYKGMLTPAQVPAYFPDLVDEAFESALALIHSRFSTNTLPTWPLAHPFRTLAHNGEINTIRGNVNWMRSREAILESDLFTTDEISKMRPITQEGSSDSGILDNVVELLMLGGRSLPHVMMMLIPEAWEKDPEIAAERKAFYEYHGGLIEPWDGPASIAFTDGTLIGATLDRNGLRPSRYMPHRRQPADHGRGGRRAERAAGEGGAEGPPAAGQDVRGLARRGPHHPRRGDQGPHLRRAALRGSGSTRTRSSWPSWRRPARCCSRRRATS